VLNNKNIVVMISVYIIVALFVMLFSGDSGVLNSTECILLGLFWPIVFVVVCIVGLCMCLITDIKYAKEYFQELKLKKKVNKLIVEMVSEFNKENQTK
jgi:formate-dependent nitrite reductase membrane component NrfD